MLNHNSNYSEVLEHVVAKKQWSLEEAGIIQWILTH